MAGTITIRTLEQAKKAKQQVKSAYQQRLTLKGEWRKLLEIWGDN
jgi:hypothetical protein